MDYIVQDGIGIKIDSLLLTDDYVDANVTFKFDENVNVDSDKFSFGCAIYAENKNIYGIYKRMNLASTCWKYGNRKCKIISRK